MTWEPHLETFTRRQALAMGAAAIAAQGLPLSAAPAEEHPWIDAHSHIWTQDFAKYPLAKGVKREEVVPATFTTEELLALARKHRVGRVVLIQHSYFYLYDNSYMLDAIQAHPKAFRIVGMVDSYAADATERMKMLHEKNVTGFRITPRVYGKKWLEGEMPAMWKTAATTGQKICCLIDPSQLEEITAMCAKFPETGVVIDHFARVGIDGEIREADLQALCKLAKYKNTTVKISAFYALGKKKPPHMELAPMIRRLLDAFTPERLMWASDAPYQMNDGNTYTDSLALIQDRLDFLSVGDREHLLRKTAERVFFYR